MASKNKAKTIVQTISLAPCLARDGGFFFTLRFVDFENHSNSKNAAIKICPRNIVESAALPGVNKNESLQKNFSFAISLKKR